MAERLECEVLQKARYINTLTFTYIRFQLLVIISITFDTMQSYYWLWVLKFSRNPEEEEVHMSRSVKYTVGHKNGANFIFY